MRVLAHPDPHVLEAELLERIAGAQRGDPLAPVLVVVPTVRLADHMRRRIAERLGTRLAVEILHHRALAARIVEEAGDGRPEVASPALLEALLRSVLDTLRGNGIADFVREHPRALRSLFSTLRDLREAAIAPTETKRLLAEGRGPELAAIHAAYVAALETREPCGLLDDALLAAAAAPRAAVFAKRYRAILHHGAYELVGIWLDLTRALDPAGASTWLLPFAPGLPSGRYGERFARRYLLAPGAEFVPVEPRPGGFLGARVGALYDEGARLAPRPADASMLATAQGALAEAELASRLALRASAEGVEPPEIVLLARSLTPYASALESVVESSGLSWEADLRFPLRREPAVRDFLALLRAAVDGFPRSSTAEILRSPHVRWTALVPDPSPFPGDLAEPWSRRAGVVGGVEGWTLDLQAWAAACHVLEDASDAEREREERRAAWRAPLAEAVGRAVKALDAAVLPEAIRVWSAHADHVARLVHDLIAVEAGGDDGAVGMLLDAVDHLRGLETRVGLTRPVPFAEALTELERVVDETSRPLPSSGAGGIRILDVAQARGLTFERVFLLGMNAGVFPRPPREDPFLDDEARALLREAVGRPLAVRREQEEEERLLLALALGAARGPLHVSWQRADDEGKAATASPALREVARVLLGEPDAARLREAAFRIAAHPARRIEDFAARAGMLRHDEALLRSALAGAGDAAAARLIDLDPDLEPGIEMLRATESFAPGSGRYDGRTGIPERGGRPRSVTSLERLGRCPLQFFFRHRLGVYPLEAETSRFGLEPAELGTEVHAVLESLYRRLRDEGLFPSRDATALLKRAGELFPEVWRETLGTWGERMRESLPLLHAAETERWRSAVLSFVAEDLRIAVAESREAGGFETRASTTIPIGERPVELEGRFDRVFIRSGAPVVADYKTRGNVIGRVSIAALLKAEYLQSPLYRILAGGDAEVEILGVGPEFFRERGKPKERRASFRGFDAAQEAGFRETLAVLIELDRTGRFPLRSGDHCDYCDYRPACRRNHPPTREREAHATDAADFRDVGSKTTRPKRYTLAEVRAARRGGETA